MFRKMLPFCLFVILLSACTTFCSDSQLVQPNHLLPDIGAMVTSSRPTFSWRFETESGCHAGMYVVLAGTDPLLDTSYPSDMKYIESSEGELSIAPSYDAFEDCSIYYWHVRAGGPTLDVYSHVSMFKTDFHGTCTWPSGCPSSTNPPKPNAWRPYPGQTVNTLNPDLVWKLDEPTCEPGDYYFEVSDSADFAHKIIEGATIDRMHKEPSPYLENCGHYYWRVIARNGPHTTTSWISEFWTDIGGCSRPVACTADQLVADTLVYPVGGEEVTDPRVFLIWKSNLPDCVPPTSDFYVSANADFSDYVIHGGTSAEGSRYPDVTTFSEPFDIYHDCSTYYWKTGLNSDTTTIWSEVATFRTNFGSVCTGIGSPIGDLLDRIRFDCINPNLSVIVFEFTAPMQGKYSARVDNQTWNCEFQAGDNQTLICTGPYVQENVSKQVVLLDLTTQKEALTKEMITPICELPTSKPPQSPQCKEPAIPCIQFGCTWNPDSCRCEKNGGACPGQ